MRCPYCNGEHSATARFCPMTGRPLGQQSQQLPPRQELEKDISASTTFGEILQRSFDFYKTHVINLALILGIVMLPSAMIHGCISVLAYLPVKMSHGVVSEMQDLGQSIKKDTARFSELTKKALSGGLSDSEQDELKKLQVDLLRHGQSGIATTTALAGTAVSGFLLAVLSLLVLAIGSALIYFLAMPLSLSAFIVYVSGSLAKKGISWTDAWRGALRRFSPILVTHLLVALGVFLGCVFCLLPGIIFGFLCMFTAPVVMLEDKSAFDAIKRSFTLVTQDLVSALLVFLCYLVVGLVTSILGNILSFGSHFLHPVIGGFLNVFALPLPMLVAIFVYIRMRNKEDGYCIETLKTEFVRMER